MILNLQADTAAIGGAATYCCSKAALTMLTKCSALELAKHNIRANCVRPTAMQTRLMSDIDKKCDPEMYKDAMELLGRRVLKKPLETFHVADLVLFLSGPQSCMMTGEAVTIDCGFSIG